MWLGPLGIFLLLVRVIMLLFKGEDLVRKPSLTHGGSDPDLCLRCTGLDKGVDGSIIFLEPDAEDPGKLECTELAVMSI